MELIKKYKGYFILLVLLMLFLLIFFVIVKYNAKNDETVQEGPVLENDHVIENITNRNLYISVEKYVNLLIDCLNDNNEEILNYYLDESLIGKELELINDYQSNQYIIDSIKYIDNANNITVFIEVSLYYNNSKKNMYLINKIDMDNNAFSFNILSKSKYIEESEKILSKVDHKYIIDQNDYNEFKMDVVNDLNMCAYYLSDYKKKINYDINKAYNSLSEENRYKTLEEYKDYVNDNKDLINNGYIVKYNGENLNSSNNAMRYYCEDSNGKVYTFEEKSLNEYDLSFTY